MSGPSPGKARHDPVATKHLRAESHKCLWCVWCVCGVGGVYDVYSAYGVCGNGIGDTRGFWAGHQQHLPHYPNPGNQTCLVLRIPPFTSDSSYSFILELSSRIYFLRGCTDFPHLCATSFHAAHQLHFNDQANPHISLCLPFFAKLFLLLELCSSVISN